MANIIAQIEAEDKSVQTVDIRSKRGKSFNPEDTLDSILKDDFEILINDRVLPVTAPVFSGTLFEDTRSDQNTQVSDMHLTR